MLNIEDNRDYFWTNAGQTNLTFFNTDFGCMDGSGDVVCLLVV